MIETDSPSETANRDGCMTQQEIADEMGVTRAMISLIERRALSKIRRECELRGWKFEDFFEE